MVLIGAALGAAGAIAGGLMSSRAARKARRAQREQLKKNQDWYDRRYNEDATQRADAQRLLTRTEDMLRNRSKAAAGTAAVMGGTTESVAAAKEANNQAMVDATAQFAANADARKDAIEQQYLQTEGAITNNMIAAQQAQANAIGQAAQGVANAASQINFGGDEEDVAKALKAAGGGA